MRPALVFLAFVATVLGQTSEPETITFEPSPVLTTDSDTQPTITPGPSPDTTTEPSATTPPPPSSTALPPSGGGPTCVQRCLAQSAASVGCRSGADLACLCNSQTYLSVARTCFSSSACDDGVSQSAVRDYAAACTVTTTPVDTSISESTRAPTPIPTPTSRTRTTNDDSPTRPPSGSSTLTTQTIAFTSGAVISISRGVSSTVTSGFTTIRTGQTGDVGAGGGAAPTSGSDAGGRPANNGAQVGRLSAGTVGLGLVGGMAVLVF